MNLGLGNCKFLSRGDWEGVGKSKGHPSLGAAVVAVLAKY